MRAASSHHDGRPFIVPERRIHFGTVTPPNVDQHPTFDPESSLLWESSALAVAQSARRPTAVPKWIPLVPDMDGALRGVGARGGVPSVLERLPLGRERLPL